jgi:hypothetical protein
MRQVAIENEFAKFWIDDGILHFVYNQGIIIDLHVAKKIVEDRIRCQDNIPYPAFADCRGLKEINREARNYLAKEGSNLIVACALLSDSIVHKAMANFYLTLNKPSTPTKLFTEKSAALAWLQQYVKLDSLKYQ